MITTQPGFRILMTGFASILMGKYIQMCMLGKMNSGKKIRIDKMSEAVYIHKEKGIVRKSREELVDEVSGLAKRENHGGSKSENWEAEMFQKEPLS